MQDEKGHSPNHKLTHREEGRIEHGWPRLAPSLSVLSPGVSGVIWDKIFGMLILWLFEDVALNIMMRELG